MRADVRDDDGQLASGPPIEVPVEVLSVGEVRFPECAPSSCDNGLAILARQARRRFCASTCPHRSTVAAVPVPGHSGAARLVLCSSWCYGAAHTVHTPLGLPRSVHVREKPGSSWVLGLGSWALAHFRVPCPACHGSFHDTRPFLCLCFRQCDRTAHLTVLPPARGCCGVRRASLPTDGP